MNQLTIEIQSGNADGTIWQALAPAENIATGRTAQEMAEAVAGDQNLTEGGSGPWRVRVWDGHDADTGTDPAAEYGTRTYYLDIFESGQQADGAAFDWAKLQPHLDAATVEWFDKEMEDLDQRVLFALLIEPDQWVPNNQPIASRRIDIDPTIAQRAITA